MGKKTFSVLGDSMSTFRGLIPSENRWFYDSGDEYQTGISSKEQTWWWKAIAAEGGEFLSNASFSGSMVQGWGFPAGSSMERAQQILGPDGEEPDVVYVYMGINDYGWGSPEAQAKGGSFASPASFDSCKRSLLECPDIDSPSGFSELESQVDPKEYEWADTAGLAPEGALDRFGEAYSRLIQNVRTVAPNAEVRCITLSPARIKDTDTVFCYAIRGIELDDYNDAIRNAAKENGAKVVDVRELGLDYYSIDGTHPTPEGMEQLACMVLASLGDEDALSGHMEGMESMREPQDGLEAGNPNSPAKASGWKLVVEK